VLVVRTVAQRREVSACCGACAGLGVRAGLTLAHARALLPAGLAARVLVVEDDPPARAAALERLAHWATRFCPIVAPERDQADGLMLDITGCAHLFGGETRLLARLVSDLRRLGLTGRAASAETLGCAWAVARFGAAGAVVPRGGEAAAVGPLPVEALRLEPAAVAGLAKVGVRRVCELARLPRAEVASRYGAGTLSRLDAGLARSAPEAITGVRTPPTVRAERAFAGPTTRLEAVMRAGEEVVAELCGLLERRVVGVREAVLTLRRVDAEPVSIGARLSRPSAGPRHLWSLLRPRLERANLGFGVEAVEVLALRTGRLATTQGVMGDGGEGIEGPRDQGSKGTRDRGIEGSSSRLAPLIPRSLDPWIPSASLIDTLTERLGEGRVLRARPVERHDPRRVWRMEPALHAWTRGFERVLLETRLTAHERPAVMLARPEPAAALALLPDGPPSGLRWRGRDWRVLAADGPERILAREEGSAEEGTEARRHEGTAHGRHAPGGRRWLAVLDGFRVQVEGGLWLWCARAHGGASGDEDEARPPPTTRWMVLGHW
jgi:protein ImuB